MEGLIRFGSFLTLLIIMAFWESFAPRRKLTQSRIVRWVNNLALSAVNVILLRVSVGAAAYNLAIFCQEQSWGFLNTINWFESIDIFMTWIFLDFAIYLQHVLSHSLPIFWRLHRVHHADLDLDASSGLRFHPLEIFVSLGYKCLLIVAIGANPTGVLLFELILNLGAVFNHSNIYISEKLDHYLKWFIVTPDMHRIHHSSEPSEHNANYGFSISCWDRLCGTYLAQPLLSQHEIEIGLKGYRDPGLTQNLLGMLVGLIVDSGKNDSHINSDS